MATGQGGSGHGHGHSHAGDGHGGRLAVVLGLTCLVLVVEVVGAAVTGSLALLADAGHMLTDVVGLTLPSWPPVLARRPVTDQRTWGFRRAEVLAAAAQAAVLLAVGRFVLVEGVRRLFAPPRSSPARCWSSASLGLAGNLVGSGSCWARAVTTSTCARPSSRSRTTPGLGGGAGRRRR